MDLGTVLRRLERRRYVYPTAFADDVRLTFRNAMSYNDEGDPVYESAAELSGIFEARWASIEAELPHPLPPDDKLPRLPVARVPEKRDVRLRKKKGKMAGKADAAALDELDLLVPDPEHGADSPMQVILVAILVKFTL
jgi:hypothetical protein